MQCCSCFNFIYEWINVSRVKSTWKTFLLFKDICSFLVFSMFLILMQIIKKMCYMLHIASYHYYPLVKINFYFSMSCHLHMNMCCLIQHHVDMLTLFKILLTKEQMLMQKVRIKKWFLHLTFGKNHDGVISILYMIFNIFFYFFFLFHRI